MHPIRASTGRQTASVVAAVIGVVAGFTLVVMLVAAFVRPRPPAPAARLPGASTIPTVARSGAGAAAQYHKEIKPILEQFCFDCHADGMKKGNMALDEFKDDADLIAQKGQWLSVLKNVRAGVMPPPGKSRPTEAQQRQLADWSKFGAFGIERGNPDQGRGAVHRGARAE